MRFLNHTIPHRPLALSNRSRKCVSAPTMISDASSATIMPPIPLAKPPLNHGRNDSADRGFTYHNIRQDSAICWLLLFGQGTFVIRPFLQQIEVIKHGLRRGKTKQVLKKIEARTFAGIVDPASLLVTKSAGIYNARRFSAIFYGALVMRRIGQTIHLKPEMTQEYKRLHLKIWPEIEHAIRASGITNYSIYLKDGVMFAYFEYTGPDDEFEARMDKLAKAPRMQEWWGITKAIQIPLATRKEGEWWADMDEVFHQD
jgi:L-rhamnose mutarotase